MRTDENKAWFFIEKEGKYVLEFDDEHTAVHIFVDAPRDFSDYGQPTRIFGAGVHEVGKIVLKNGDRIFVEEGARVKGTFFGEGIEDAAIYGYGVIDGGLEIRKSPDCYEKEPNGCLKFYECTNLSVEGVHWWTLPYGYAIFLPVRTLR